MSTTKYTTVIRKITYFVGATLAIVFLTMLIVPYFFKDQINASVKKIANEHINGELSYSDIDLSFFSHFPSLTASVHQVKVKSAAPFQDSLLLDVKEISLGVNILSLVQSKISLDKFIISQGEINLWVDSTGAANYNIYKSDTIHDNKDESSNNDSQIAFKLLKLQDIDLQYVDASIPLEICAEGLNYEGRGDLMASVFDLHTNAHIDAFSFTFNNEKYVDNKSINAQLITQINTSDLSFVFERNDILINKLPVRFKGAFSFLKNGYHMDFKLKSQESTLSELLSLVPQGYADWLKQTQVKGTSEVFMNLEGDYIVEENKMPNLSLGLVIKDGYMAYNNAKIPLSDWNARVRMDLPQLNPNALAIELRQFEFKVADGFFKSNGNIAGLDPMQVDYQVESSLDLGTLYQAVQFPNFSFAGQLDLQGFVKGTYATDTLTQGIRNHKEVYISSIPTFNIKNTLKNGYFKLSDLPAAIERIEYTLEASAANNQIKNAKIAVRNIDIKALNNFIKGHADIKDFQKLHLDANVQADIDLADIKKVYPIDSVDLAGNVFVNIISEGFMDLTKNIIPETSATITMKNGFIKSWQYPIPLEQINVETYINSKSGSLKDLSVKILPISFRVAGEPFFLNADFENFNNIKYAIKSKGKLNLEPIYKIFALEGVNVDGFIRTDLDLAGLQSDALQGRYDRLKNNGHINIGHINVNTDLFPQTIHIKDGRFSFKKEKLSIVKFIAQYGNNEISLKGFINNIINYLTLDSDILKGNFDFYSKKINVDDFMFFAENSSSTPSNNVNTGVVLLPQNLEIQVNGLVDQIVYDGLTLKNFKGNMLLKSGNLEMNETGFELAGLKTKMDIRYQPLNPRKAKFDFIVQADSFDIQRAYHEIPLFQQMVTSAKNLHGKVSLNYQLAGLLDDQMSPIMPSIQGKGVLTLDQIKFLNFKLLNSISKESGKQNFLDSDVKQVKINTSIKNNVMTIERTKMKMAGFRPRFEGQVTLDGKMNIGFRLGLPPWGILGIPMRITGTSEDFRIKLGKYREDDLDTEMDEEDRALYQTSIAQDSVKTL